MITDITKILGKERDITQEEKQELLGLVEDFYASHKTFDNSKILRLCELMTLYMGKNVKNHNVTFEIDDTRTKKGEAWYDIGQDKVYICIDFINELKESDSARAFAMLAGDLFHELEHQKQDLTRIYLSKDEYEKAGEELQQRWIKDVFKYDLSERYITEDEIGAIESFFETYNKHKDKYAFGDITRYKANLIDSWKFNVEYADSMQEARTNFLRSKKIIDDYRAGKKISEKKKGVVSAYKKYIYGGFYEKDINTSHYDLIDYELDAEEYGYKNARKFIESLSRDFNLKIGARKWLKHETLPMINAIKGEVIETRKYYKEYFEMFIRMLKNEFNFVDYHDKRKEGFDQILHSVIEPIVFGNSSLEENKKWFEKIIKTCPPQTAITLIRFMERQFFDKDKLSSFIFDSLVKHNIEDENTYYLALNFIDPERYVELAEKTIDKYDFKSLCEIVDRAFSFGGFHDDKLNLLLTNIILSAEKKTQNITRKKQLSPKEYVILTDLMKTKNFIKECLLTAYSEDFLDKNMPVILLCNNKKEKQALFKNSGFLNEMDLESCKAFCNSFAKSENEYHKLFDVYSRAYQLPLLYNGEKDLYGAFVAKSKRAKRVEKLIQLKKLLSLKQQKEINKIDFMSYNGDDQNEQV